MIIDVEARCKRLGISNKARFSAERKVDDAIGQTWDGNHFGDFSFEILPEILDEDELIAYIRYNDMHIQYPEWFTWNGARKSEPVTA